MQRRTLIAAIMAIISIGFAVGVALVSLSSFAQVNDLPEFYTAARMFLSGQGSKIYDLAFFSRTEHLYFPELGSRSVFLFLTPAALPLLLPLAFIPLGMAPQMWLLFNATALACSLSLMWKHFNLPAKDFCLPVAFLMLSGPVIEALRIGQLSFICLLSVSVALVAAKNKKPFICAAALSLLILKPQFLLPVIALLAGARRWKILIHLVLFMIAYTLISCLGVGAAACPGVWDKAVRLITDPAVTLVLMQPQLNPTVRGQMLRVLHGYGQIWIIGNVLYLAVNGFALALGNRIRAEQKWFARGLFGVLPLALVASPHCHVYDLSLLIPCFFVLVKWKDALMPAGASYCQRYFYWISVAGMALFLYPAYVLIHYKYLQPGGAWNPLFFVLLVFSIFAAIRAWRAPAGP